ncbi:M23 family peptidase [Marinicauda salina]|uniref:M23 family peptidase n=1 Tax=Marinicauda salina TaxID=2135793 RepID=A0A2U2BSE9_9PROT|nr:M23 family metallopeptidase [Marinicauda salina]PWE16927.1 M23 family peptidase [Marinicauda salina]
MERGRDYILALIVAVIGLAALIFWPAPDDGGAPPDEPGEETPEPEEPEPEDPEPDEREPEEPEPTEPETLTDYWGDEFSYLPAGDLIEGSGTGREDDTIYAEGIRFPIELPAAYANSQVYMPGGSQGGGGWQCDAENYEYPWRDNYCETRGYETPMCPAGTGHQGQDIRPPACPPTTPDDEDDFFAVAVADGDITSVSGHIVKLLADDGAQYYYLHLEPTSLWVAPGDRVEQGDRIGIVSNYFGSTPTTYHLHFEIRQSVMVDGELTFTPVPPYASLVDSYERLLREESDS